MFCARDSKLGRDVAIKILPTELARDRTRPIPLAWSPQDIDPIAAIEVYPATTRLARSAPDQGGSLVGLESWLTLPPDIDPSRLSADAIDALVCVLAAADFVAGRAVAPHDTDLARAEGWIWAPRGRGVLAG